MRGPNFEVRIIADRVDLFRQRGASYASLPNGSEYQIEVSNFRRTPCDAEIYVDGQRVGQWQVPASETVTIERPESSGRRFTFFSESDRRAVGATIGAESNGLVQVIFKPAKDSVSEDYLALNSSSSPRTLSSPKQGASYGTRNRVAGIAFAQSGVTVLGRASDQRFRTVRQLTPLEIDWDNTQQIDLRLVTDRGQSSGRYGSSYPERLG